MSRLPIRKKGIQKPRKLTSEASFRHNQVVPFLEDLPNTVVFTIQQTTIRGDPDLMCCINSRFVALELKKRGEKPRRLQQYKLDIVKNKGKGIALAVDPDNWENVKLLLTAIAKGEICTKLECLTNN